MSIPNPSASMASSQNITDPLARSKINRNQEQFSFNSVGCNGFWRDAALVVPSAMLVLYLGFQAKRNLKKLIHRKSFVMIAYYALLWFAALLNLSWALLQGWQCTPGKAIAWNLLSLFTECGTLSLEISILMFLLQENYASGFEAPAQTFLVSGCFVAVDIFLQAIFLFGFGVPLFINAVGRHLGKWTVLFAHTLMFTAVYGYILFVHYSKWRDKLPPRPSFYNYVVVMFLINLAGLLAGGLAVFGLFVGVWLYNLTIVCRHSLYLPFLYATFLTDFFQEEDWLLDNAYYSEMKDAGFFDTEWE